MTNKLTREFFLFAFGFSLAIFGIWLAVHWPGFFNYDSFYVLDKVHDGIFDDWFSYLYVVYLQILGQPMISVGWVGVFQVVLSSTLGSLIIAKFFGKGSPLWLCFISLFCFAVSPTSAIYNIFYIYDWPCAWMVVALAFIMSYQLWRERHGGKPFSVIALVGIAVLCVVSVRLRSDGAPLFLLLPLALIIFYKMNRRRWLVFSAALSLSLIIFYSALPTLLNLQKYDNYAVTAFLNPLANIMANRGYPRDPSPNAKSESVVIDHVVDYNQLVNERSDFEIPVLHKGGMRESTAEQRREFYILSGRIFLRNFDLYLKNRIRMFSAIMGGSAAYYVSDGLSEDYPFAVEMKQKLQIHKDSILPSLLPRLQSIQAGTFNTTGLGHIAFATVYLSLLLCTLALFCVRWIPCSAIFAAIILCRLPIVFLFAPAANFKYVFSTYLALFFLAPLLGLELKELVHRRLAK